MYYLQKQITKFFDILKLIIIRFCITDKQLIINLLQYHPIITSHSRNKESLTQLLILLRLIISLSNMHKSYSASMIWLFEKQTSSGLRAMRVRLAPGAKSDFSWHWMAPHNTQAR